MVNKSSMTLKQRHLYVKCAISFPSVTARKVYVDGSMICEETFGTFCHLCTTKGGPGRRVKAASTIGVDKIINGWTVHTTPLLGGQDESRFSFACIINAER